MRDKDKIEVLSKIYTEGEPLLKEVIDFRIAKDPRFLGLPKHKAVTLLIKHYSDDIMLDVMKLNLKEHKGGRW